MNMSEILVKIEKKMERVVKRNLNIIPYTTEDGHFIDCLTTNRQGWWTNGFWGGLLWQLYNYSHNELYKQQALFVEETLDSNLINYKFLDHDNGFKWLLTSGISYDLFKNEKSLNRLILAGQNLAGRFNIKGNFIRAWNDKDKENRSGIAIIDCMMNLGLLYKISEILADPHYKDIAIRHADMVKKFFVRADYSVRHIVEFDSKTGEYLRTKAGQGYDENSSWTRGQAWAIYGFIISCKATGRIDYLEEARNIADCFIANLVGNYLVKLDFKQPENDNVEDSAASAIASSALLDLAEITGDNKYYEVALKILETLVEKRLDLRLESDNLLMNCSEAYHSGKRHISMVYADYFFIEALLKLVKKDLKPWF